MRKHPPFIETKARETFRIDSYENGKFFISSTPPMIYNIEDEVFYKIENGELTMADMSARNPELYSHWLKRKKKLTLKK